MKFWKVALATFVIFLTGILVGVIGVRLVERVHQREYRAYLNTLEPQANPTISFANPNVGRSNREGGPMVFPITTRPAGRAVAREFLERLDRELKLSPEQRKLIDGILNEGQIQSKSIWEKIAPELRAELKKSRERMRDVLTEDQNKRLDELMKRPPKPVRAHLIPANSTNYSDATAKNPPTEATSN